MSETPSGTRQLHSLVTPEGELLLSIALVDTPRPGPREVLVRVEAAPVNPSDLGLLLAMADLSQAVADETADEPTVRAPIPEAVMPAPAARGGQAMPVGNEGAGVVVAAGESPQEQAPPRRTVGFPGGAAYVEYCLASPRMCLPLPEGTDPVDGASAFVNPRTALGMVETMRREGHTALVHTAAASSLGQMLHRVCAKDGIGLVNVVRKEDQAALLREMGAKYVVNTSDPTFLSELTEALVATGATIGFDAIGGGKLAGQILGCMEEALNRTAKEYSRYGSSTHKQVYIYGGLDTGPTELVRSYGMA